MGPFSIVYADPPWAYRDRGKSGSKSPSGSATHYETLTSDQIAGIDVGSISASDSVCFLWATNPLLPTGLRVLEAWGFDYVTVAFVWVKTGRTARSEAELKGCIKRRVDAALIRPIVESMRPHLMPAFQMGQGSHTRANPELCLFGRRGRGVKRISASVRSEVLAPPSGHSVKPIEVARRIEQLFGDVPRVELFSRRRMDGWASWGNEVASDLELRVPGVGE